MRTDRHIDFHPNVPDLFDERQQVIYTPYEVWANHDPHDDVIHLRLGLASFSAAQGRVDRVFTPYYCVASSEEAVEYFIRNEGLKIISGEEFSRLRAEYEAAFRAKSK